MAVRLPSRPATFRLLCDPLLDLFHHRCVDDALQIYDEQLARRDQMVVDDHIDRPRTTHTGGSRRHVIALDTFDIG
ncbi:hypothetical protein A5789_27130 [Nocardia sp. 852002-51101_SCH5132738]|nr:hypothetical protein A5789_27130 [Nocardia sp. 852002-51101_SCH5132738]OBB54160.1 hypothetical protein A5748_12870 [Nocardia sp. 852002-51244_SCH5132740]OBF85235.1 hypothetical protein A9X06_13595 [Mycobacterium sp. 852002-51759_SCH5129042]